ncbi:MAG: ATP-binding protein [Chloroflexota bacterium]
MFRSIAIKLTIAFVLVALVGVALMGWLVLSRTTPRIAEFNENNRTRIVVQYAEDWYAENGSWDGIQRTLFSSNNNNNNNEGPSLGRGVILTDETFKVLNGRMAGYDRGDFLKSSDRQKAIPIDNEGQTVGYLLLQHRGNVSDGAQRVVNAAEDLFLRQFRSAILYGAGISILVALIVGAFLAGQLSRPIRKLTNATQQLASGNLGHQVDIVSNDEIGNLAAGFNKMSRDLAEGERLRQQMTADIAHDLRTPLSVILGYTEALSEGKFEGDPEIYDAMHREARHLNRLIDDLRTLSLADAGKLSLNKTRVHADEVLQHSVQTWRMKAAEKEIELASSVQSPFEIDIDPGRIAQVMSNLISNALRYTPKGGEIQLNAFDDGQHGIFKISDTGKGIPDEQLPHIFDRFYRADGARQAGAGQSGLGLTIVKSLVEAHGGSISAASREGSGTTFTIKLPL